MLNPLFRTGPFPARSWHIRVSLLWASNRPSRRAVAALVTVALAATGCAKPLYDWGSYEASIYRMYKDDFSPVKEIDRLAKEVAKTEAKGKHVPPGKYAHLAYLCYTAGDQRQAEKYFLAEKAAFPESAVFVDGMLERMR